MHSLERELDVLVIGEDDTAPALLAHHDAPGDAAACADWGAIAVRHGLRLIAISRPGYATATRHPGRRVVDVVEDARFVMKTLGVPWSLAVGWSGGGPHALACGALLKNCRGVATIASAAPDDAAFAAARNGEAAFRSWLDERVGTGAITATARHALAHGIDGWVDDALALVQPWGFEPERLRVPVAVWESERLDAALRDAVVGDLVERAGYKP